MTSSANRRWFTLVGGGGKSYSIMLNRSGLMTAPWGTPLEILLGSDVWLPSLMTIERSRRKLDIQPRQFPCIPIFESLDRMPLSRQCHKLC